MEGGGGGGGEEGEEEEEEEEEKTGEEEEKVELYKKASANGLQFRMLGAVTRHNK
jgi:hypothetical protein